MAPYPGLLERERRVAACRLGRWRAAVQIVNNNQRAAIPANPVNSRAKHPDGRFGRGIQYPFVKPGRGEYLADWDENKLEPWKQVMRDLLAHHAAREDSPIGQISCEHIPAVDYGAGHTYSIFEQNVACARWLRAQWAVALAQTPSIATATRPLASTSL